MDQAGLHRSKDPGAGAFTPFHNQQLISRGGVRAGVVGLSNAHRQPYCFVRLSLLVYRTSPVTYRTLMQRCFGSPIDRHRSLSLLGRRAS
jgi:hypothetical protein